MSKITTIAKDPSIPKEVRLYFSDIIDKFRNQNSEIWQKEVKARNHFYHRSVLLKRGRADFNNPINGLTTDELVLLYNYYYMPMHFISSYWLYNMICETNYLEKLINDKNPIFIDWGCGTFASSVAFASIFKKYKKKNAMRDITYIGVDTAEPMLKYCLNFPKQEIDLTANKETEIEKLIWNYNIEININIIPFNYTAYLVDNFIMRFGSPDYDFLKELYIHRKEKFEPFNKYHKVDLTLIEDEFTLIINFSYLFASFTLNPIDLAVEINRLLIRYEKLNVFAFFQNPNKDDLNTKWEEFKKIVPMQTISKGLEQIPFFTGSILKYEILHKPSEVPYKAPDQLRHIENTDNIEDMVAQIKTLCEEANSNKEKEYIISYGRGDTYLPPDGLTDEDMINIFIEAFRNKNGELDIPTNFNFSPLYISLFKEKLNEADFSILEKSSKY